VTRRYRAFISYSWADKDWGGWLHRTLELYRTPRPLVGRASPLGPVPAGLHPIFKDREEEAAGHGVGAAIEAALAASEFLIVICSPRSAKSEWVNREVAWFKTHKDKSRILALIVGGEPGASAAPGREAEECFPKTLAFKVGADLQPTDEREDPPLAADARKEGDGKRAAKLKLAAALLGVGLDDLVRRDERRRTIRRRLVTGAAFGLAGVLAGLSIFAFSQRDAAVLARNDAVKARDDAEGLIEHILTDLKSDLEGYGTLKSVTAIGNRAIGYYEGQDVRALSPDQLGRRARVLLMLGEADNKRGDLDAALARYKEAAATTSEQLARDPQNPQRMFDHAQSVFWVGYIAWQRGDRKTAKVQFTEYHDLARKLVASDPANEDWQMEVGYAVANLGILAMDQGAHVEAELAFRTYISVISGLRPKKGGETTQALNLGQGYAWLADALRRQVNLEEARAARLSEIEMYASALKRNPKNASLQAPMQIANYRLAEVELARGQVNQALRSAHIATQLGLELLAREPEKSELIDGASQALAILGDIQDRAGEPSNALRSLTEAARLAEELVGSDNSVTQWRAQNRSYPKLVMARILESAGDGAEKSRALYDEVIDDLKSLSPELSRGTPSDLQATELMIVRRYCEALAGRARTMTSPDKDWARVVELLQARQEHLGGETLTLLAEAYRQTGDVAAAAAIAEGLYAAGFRHPDFTQLIENYPNIRAPEKT